jgi:hypothetical protein
MLQLFIVDDFRMLTCGRESDVATFIALFVDADGWISYFVKLSESVYRALFS